MAKRPTSRAVGRRRERREENSRRLTLDEARRLRAWAVEQIRAGNREGALVVALLGTAGRRFEVAALRCGDVRLDASGAPEVFFELRKGGEPGRTPVTRDTFELLRAWVGDRAAGEPLLPSGRGGFLEVTSLWHAFRRATAAAGIKKRLGVHATRHAAGLILLHETGGDLWKVKAFLGHRSIKTTELWYAHVDEGALREAIEGARL